MVAGSDDQRVLQFAGLVKTLNQILQGPIHLDSGGGHVCLGSFTVWQFRNQILVLVCNPVPTVAGVTTDGEIVDMEGGIAVDIVVHTHLHHVLVPLGPQPVGAGGILLTGEGVRVVVPAGDILLPCIAQIGVGFVATVHILIVVVAVNLVAQPAQLLGQGEVDVGAQFAGALHGDGASVFGVEAQQGLALPVGGAGEVEGGVVVVEYEALVGQLIEGGGQLRVDGVAGKALHHDLDDVIPLEHPGVLVFVGGGDAVEIVCQPSHTIAGRGLCQGGQIHVHHVGGCVDHRLLLGRFFRFRWCGGAGRVGPASAPAIVGTAQPLDGAEVVAQIAFWWDDHVLHIQAQHGPKPQLLHLVINGAVHLVEGAGRQIPLPGEMDDPNPQQMECGRRGQGESGKSPVGMQVAYYPPKKDQEQHKR